MSQIYADHNATTPLDPEVRAAMDEALGVSFGNPSSIHQAGQAARRLVERSRAQVAELLNAAADEILFTSGGTEADNLAIGGAVGAAANGREGIITSAVEHKAVLDPCLCLRDMGHPVVLLPVDRDGRVEDAALRAAAKPDVALMSVMMANNDTGTLQPVAEVVRAGHSCGALVHTDAVQAAGRLPIDVQQLQVDLLSLSAHKLHGPKGVGALYLRHGVRIAPRTFGGRQERSLRPGTENVPGIVGFGKACELARVRLRADSDRLAVLRDRFEEQIVARVPGARVHGGRLRLPNTANIGFSGFDGEAIVINLDILGMAASTGAACGTAERAPSHVLLAMGQSEAEARSSVRFSFGRETTDQEIERAVTLVVRATDILREARR